uniref:(northern house mosquito) hypothetical protein n=1 Tax=Culex pipiens TaxID=7175 RepID=A0A8D8CB56_CULPI
MNFEPPITRTSQERWASSGNRPRVMKPDRKLRRKTLFIFLSLWFTIGTSSDIILDHYRLAGRCTTSQANSCVNGFGTHLQFKRLSSKIGNGGNFVELRNLPRFSC